MPIPTHSCSPPCLIPQRRSLASISRGFGVELAYWDVQRLLSLMWKMTYKWLGLTEKVLLRTDSKFWHTGRRISMLLKFKQRAEARARADSNRGEKKPSAASSLNLSGEHGSGPLVWGLDNESKCSVYKWQKICWT